RHAAPAPEDAPKHNPDVQAPARAQAPGKDKPDWQTSADTKTWREAVDRAHRANLVGVAFSGGGIRSATFNLGVLQGLAEMKLLQRVDYLSTVSGGGYIGGWLAAWTKRLGSLREAQEQLVPKRVDQDNDAEPNPIRFLRVFSNYLTPQLGAFGADTWAIVAIYLRNMLLNQVTVLAIVTAALLLPRAAMHIAMGAQGTSGMNPHWLWAGVLALAIAFAVVVMNMRDLDDENPAGKTAITTSTAILVFAGLPLFLAAVFGGLWLVARNAPGHAMGAVPSGWYAALMGAVFSVLHVAPQGVALWRWCATLTGAAIYFLVWVVAFALGWAQQAFRALFPAQAREMAAATASAPAAEPAVRAAAPRPVKGLDLVVTLVSAAIAGAFAGWLYSLLSDWTQGWGITGSLTAGVPLVLAIFLLAGTLHIGLMGISFTDRKREWWGRLGGSLLVWGLIWLALFWLALYFPETLRNHEKFLGIELKDLAAKYLTPAWILATIGGLLAGKSGSSGEPGTETWKDTVAQIAPYVFVVGLLCWVSFVIDSAGDWCPPWTGAYALWWALAGCIALAAAMAWRVDINQFSMHLMYRNRLVRCYLGASNEKRSPNRFTGFDASDDIPLKNFLAVPDDGMTYDGPYPVLNASLNLVKGEDLAWQERKAESFVMTPRFCGYDVWLEEQDSPLMSGERSDSAVLQERRQQVSKSVSPGSKTTTDVAIAAAPAVGAVQRSDSQENKNKLDRFGYRPTANYAFPPPGGHGFFLGTAMGISGAAASPNMGFYTTPAVAFLMTVFNVRLGQWMGNPRYRKTWRRPGPRWGLFCLVNELFGGTDDQARYVYLSDGGHFENMALYELVKRRCGLIILCDAEADPTYGFTGLGNAIRKCRIDLGIDIELDVSKIKPKKTGKPSLEHCAVGKIRYDQADIHGTSGTIVYFKASLTGDEPTDVKNYKTMHDSFPHETTIDQWFTETQFESYRQLGYHEVTTAIRGLQPGTETPVSDGKKSAPATKGDAPKPAAGPAGDINKTPDSIAQRGAKLALEGAEALQASVDRIKELAAELSGSLPEKSPELEESGPDAELRKALTDFGFETSHLKWPDK
ncbi:MAG: patatin-like phospholipase family protein, partial [Candidatus Acidiferrales bacterium]